MTVENVVGLIVALCLGGYLVAAWAKPDKFYVDRR
ncbi:K(+)-transporting ATPase subunit F [Streptomyces sp. NPDC058620]